MKRRSKSRSSDLGLLRGDCLSCSRIDMCNNTNVDLVKQSYTCSLFTGVEEPIYRARLLMIEMYGDDRAIAAMISLPPELEPELEQGDKEK